MKRQMLIALMLLMVPSVLFAQGGGRGRGGFGQPQNVARLLLQEEHKTALGLSDDQVLKVTALAAKIDTLNAPIVAERQKMMQEHMKMMATMMEQMRGGKPREGMTPEQMREWIDEHLKLMDQMMGQMMDEHHMMMQGTSK